MTPDLDRWLEQATRRLSKDSAAQVRTEIQEHYQSALEAAISGGASQDEANRMALIGLGHAKTANKQYLQVLLTASESGTLSKTWWLLALCGILHAMQATIRLLFLNLSLISRAFGSPSHAAWDLGLLASLAGACTLAAGLWSAGKDHSWLLLLHGLALGAFGAILVYPWTYGQRVSFHPLSLTWRNASTCLLFVAMAASIAAFALETAKDRRRGTRERWFLIASGAASIAFASSTTLWFLISPGRLPPQISLRISLISGSSNFAFYAIFMLWFALRVHSRGIGQSGQANPVLPAPSPIHTL